MNWTIWGDPHLKPDNLDKIEALFDIAEEAGNPVLILGDLLDNKEVIRGKCLNLCLERMRRSKLRFVVLVGNHDYHNLKCEDHSLRALALLENVEVVDSPRIIYFSAEVPGLCMPYMNREADFEAALDHFPKTVPLLVMHQGVKGFDYGNGRIAEDEDGIVSEKLLKRFKKVITGHFHSYQERGNLLILGTPFSHTHGESNQQKYLGVLDPESLEVELVPTPFPQHVTVQVDCDDPEEGADCLSVTPPNAIVRAVLTGTQDHINKFDQSKWPGVKFLERPTLMENVAVSVSEQDSNEVKFQKWAEDIKKLDPKTIQRGLEILRSVQK